MWRLKRIYIYMNYQKRGWMIISHKFPCFIWELAEQNNKCGGT